MARSTEPAMTVRDVAKFLNVGNITVYRLVQAGELPGFKVAGSWRFQKADLERWIEEKKRLTTLVKRKGKQRPPIAPFRKAIPTKRRST